MTDTAGLDLAWKLNPAIGSTPEIFDTCARIVRLARRYSRIQERWCNEEMSALATERLEEREAQIEARIRDLVWDLPETDDGRITVEFDGDPHGFTVRLIPPDSWSSLADAWDQRSIGCDAV